MVLIAVIFAWGDACPQDGQTMICSLKSLQAISSSGWSSTRGTRVVSESAASELKLHVDFE